MNTQEILYEEAKKRLKILQEQGQHEAVLRDFPEHVHYSERMSLGTYSYGALFWISNQKELQDAVDNINDEKNLVYCASLETVYGMRCLSCFVVTLEDDEDSQLRERRFQEERAELKTQKIHCGYSVNLDEPAFSEWGYMSYDIAGGGIIRTA